AALAHDPECLASPDRQADVVHGFYVPAHPPEQSALDREVLLDVLELKDVGIVHGGRHFFSAGTMASVCVYRWQRTARPSSKRGSTGRWVSQTPAMNAAQRG